MKEEISVTLASDFEGDIKGALNLLFSIKKNTDAKIINIISNKTIKHKNIEIVLGLVKMLKLDFNFFNLNNVPEFEELKDNNVKNYKSLKHISKMAYSKIFIFSLINEKTIYLDTDTLIIKKIKLSKLSKISNNVYFVKNGEHSPHYWYKRYEGIFSSKKEVKNKAFNSGVIFKNIISEVENKKIFDALMESVKKNEFTYLDQAHFNYVFKEEAKFLPLKYNFPVHNSENRIVKKEKNPAILHFASKRKPWNENESTNIFFKKWNIYWNYVVDKFNLNI